LCTKHHFNIQRGRLMSLEERLSKIGNNLKDLIASAIDPNEMRKIAEAVGFVKRTTSRLDGDEFVLAMIVESVNGKKNTLGSLADTIRTIKSKSIMTIQALRKRMNTGAAMSLITKVFEKTFHIVIERMSQIIFPCNEKEKLLNNFQNVYLQDSSEFLLDPALKETFKGSSGGNGNGKQDSSVKIDLIYEIKNKFFTHFKVTDRTEPDSILGEKILEILKAGDLVIRDLGYSSLNVFQKIQEIGAYFLSRLHGTIKVYLDPLENQAICLGSFLEKNAINGLVDKTVYLGKAMFQCRLVAYKIPPDLEKERRKEYLKECKKRKRQPDQEYIKRLSFTIFITNVSVSIWMPEIVGTIYRLRWQIELIFKSWKSDLNFDYLKGKSPLRIKCFIYARLTAIMLMFTIYRCIDSVSLVMIQKETSIHKVISWIARNNRFFEIIINGFVENLWKSLMDDCKHILCKDKRKRKTTRQLLLLEVQFGL